MVTADLTLRRVPNILSLGGIAIAAIALIVLGGCAGRGGVDSALWAAGLGLLLTLPAYIAGALGAGDVKLAAAIGLLTDLQFLIADFVIASLLAGAWAVVWLYGRGVLRSIGLSSPTVRQGEATPPTRIKPVPFGAALGVGVLVTVWLREVARVA